MTRLFQAVPLSAWVVLGLAGIGGLGWAAVNQERPDCPGKIVCPLTGETVCRDQCPVMDAERPDCPGKIECPLTGEFVCEDRCPVGTPETEEARTEPNLSCCEIAK